MAGTRLARGPEPHRAGHRQRRQAWAPSQAAAAAGGQRAGRQLRQAALALRLTSTKKARAGRCQRGCLPMSRLSRCKAMREHKGVRPWRISLQGERGTKALSQAGKPLPGLSRRGLIMPSALEGTWARWEASAPGHPPLPALSIPLGRPSVTRPSHPQPRGDCAGHCGHRAQTLPAAMGRRGSHLASSPAA